MARYAEEGVRVVLVCATDGAEGEILNPRMDKPGIKERMVELRKAELETACDILGVAAIHHLGYRDSGMPESEANKHPDAFWNADHDEAVGKLVEIIRSEKPEVVLSYDESKGYEHPDHIRIYEWGREAFEAAGDPDRFPDRGAPWTPSKLYYFATFTKKRFQMLSDAAIAEGMESPFIGWLENWDSIGFEEPEITASVDCADYVEVRSKALLAHATQIDPDSFWFAIPDEMVKKVYPWEDYTLILSTVETETPEDDLFAGIDLGPS
ncbi:MAG: mycothiol S-conjugate amidase [Actinomycetota bacterium]|jgi:mycothiol S-conjugate amidase|nr:mycothiol S-conjugate amidase [Actinomycetota bacterium]